MIEFNEKVEIFFSRPFFGILIIFMFFLNNSFFSKSEHFREVPWLVLEMSHPVLQKKNIKFYATDI